MFYYNIYKIFLLKNNIRIHAVMHSILKKEDEKSIGLLGGDNTYHRDRNPHFLGGEQQC